MAFLLASVVKRDFRQPLMFEELLPRWPESFDLISPSTPELISRKLLFALQIPFLLPSLEKQTVGGRLWLAQHVGCAALSHSDTVWAAGHSHTLKQIRSALLWTVSSPGPPPDSQHNAGEKHPLESLSDHPCMPLKKEKTWQCNCFQATTPESFLVPVTFMQMHNNMVHCCPEQNCLLIFCPFKSFASSPCVSELTLALYWLLLDEPWLSFREVVIHETVQIKLDAFIHMSTSVANFSKRGAVPKSDILLTVLQMNNSPIITKPFWLVLYSLVHIAAYLCRFVQYVLFRSQKLKYMILQ